MPASDIELTPDQITSFHEHGFLALDRITTAAEVEQLRPVFDDTFKGWREKTEFTPRDLADGGDQDDGLVVQMHEMSKNLAAFANSLMRANAIAVAEQLLGPECEFRTDHAISKPAGSPAATPWHQDQWYWDPKAEYRRVSVWIPLQDVNAENGCMQFVSRRDVPDIIPHAKQDASDAWHADAASFDPATAVPCPVPAGGATIHYGKTLHYTTPNRSGQPRRAYIISCGIPSTEV